MLLAVQIGPVSVSTLPVMLALGTLGMALSVWKRHTRFSISWFQAILFTLILTVVGVAGAYLMYQLETGEWGGVSFYGSVFLIPLLMPLAGKLFRLRSSQSMDLCGPCVAIMIGCLRVNCFLSGCCGGWGMWLGSQYFTWPTQAMDSIGDFSILAWLLHVEEKGQGNGRLYPLFMAAYSIMRFLLEFLRDTPKNVIGMSNGQWYALAAVLLSLLWMLFLKRRNSLTEINSADFNTLQNGR